MSTKNLLISSIAGAVINIVLVNTPFVNFVNVLLCVGFWGSAIFAVWLYKRLNGSLTLGHAVAIGGLTGLFAGLLGLILSFVGLAGAQGLINTYGRIFAADADPDLESALTGSWVVIFNLVGVAVNIIFGVIGGLLSGVIFKSQISKTIAHRPVTSG
jgi:hypothetical protein